jgi:hypothetical protein
VKVTAARIGGVTAVAAVAAITLLPPGADAHHPEITASAVCADGLAEVRIVASAWQSTTEDHRYNSDIRILFDGRQVGQGAFLPSNNYSFTIVHRPVADGRTYTVRATSNAPWGPSGEYGSTGEFTDTRVTLPINCSATIPTTTAAPTTSTTAAPATTTTVSGGGSNTIITTTSVGTVVGGVVETRPVVPAPIAVAPKFAG